MHQQAFRSNCCHTVLATERLYLGGAFTHLCVNVVNMSPNPPITSGKTVGYGEHSIQRLNCPKRSSQTFVRPARLQSNFVPLEKINKKLGPQRLRKKHVRNILGHWTQNPVSKTAESQNGLSQKDTDLSRYVFRWVGRIVRQAHWVDLKGRLPKKKIYLASFRKGVAANAAQITQ